MVEKNGEGGKEGRKDGGEERHTQCTKTHVAAVTSRPPYRRDALAFGGIDFSSRD